MKQIEYNKIFHMLDTRLGETRSEQVCLIHHIWETNNLLKSILAELQKPKLSWWERFWKVLGV